MHAIYDTLNGKGLELDGTEENLGKPPERNSPAPHSFDSFSSTSLLQYTCIAAGVSNKSEVSICRNVVVSQQRHKIAVVPKTRAMTPLRYSRWNT